MADKLLKKALHFIRTEYSANTKLIDVLLDHSNPKEEAFSVIYILHVGSDFEEETAQRDDTLGVNRRGLEGYEVGAKEARNSEVMTELATSVHFRQPLIIKKFTHQTELDLSPAICTFIHQARVRHDNSCRILEISLQKAGPMLELSLVMEKMAKTLAEDIAEHAILEERYSEVELLRFLHEIGSVLAYAKTQDIAHRNITPNNVFVSNERKYVLGDFGGFWEKLLRSTTVGTRYYIAPEVIMNYSFYDFRHKFLRYICTNCFGKRAT